MANARVPNEFIFYRDSNNSSSRIKGGSLLASVEDKTSPNVPRGINKDAEEEDATGASRRFV